MTVPAGGRHALIVATAHYSDPKFQQLRAPAADAEHLADVLRDPAKGNFDVEVLIDEAQATVTRRIARFFRDRRPDDLLLLHFSCHGVKDERGELFLASADTEIDLLSATGVSAAWLNDQITRTRSRRTVVLLDCCFSGSFPFGMRARGSGVDAPQQLQGRGRAIITASSDMEYAYEGDQLKGEGQPSIFTAAVVEGLETGQADLDQDQLISVDDLYQYVYDRVKESTPSQTPNKMSELEGPLYLATSSYRAEVEPAPLDPELIARTEDRYAGVREGAAQELSELLASSHPPIAVAARQALAQMVEDDSRRVATRAQAALEAADRAEHERAEAERAEAARTARERAEREGAEVVAAGADRTPPPSVATRLRRRPLLTGAAVLVAVAALAILVSTLGGRDPDGKGQGSGEPTPSAAASSGLPAGIPESVAAKCARPEDKAWANDVEADAQYACGVEESGDFAWVSVDYFTFSDASKARNRLITVAGWTLDDGGEQCGARMQAQMSQRYRTAGSRAPSPRMRTGTSTSRSCGTTTTRPSVGSSRSAVPPRTAPCSIGGRSSCERERTSGGVPALRRVRCSSGVESAQRR